MKEPVRNLLVYGDGRVEEVSFRLAGNYYHQTERRPDGTHYTRQFEANFAQVMEDDGPFTLVYMERGQNRHLNVPEAVKVLVNAEPRPVDVPYVEGKDLRALHLECLQAHGGHAYRDCEETCFRCGLHGRLVRMIEFELRGEEAERKSLSALRDQLVKLSDENRTLLVENATLRRKMESMERKK